MPVTAAVYVQNNMTGPTVMQPDPKGTDVVEWAGKGDPYGEDIQIVPASILAAPAFARALSRGVLTIMEDDSDPEVVAAMQAQVAKHQARLASIDNVGKTAIVNEANLDYVTVPCVGPSPTGQCPNEVTVRDQVKFDKPPLCPMHEGLASEFVPQDGTEDGKRTVTWLRTSMGARERQTN